MQEFVKNQRLNLNKLKDRKNSNQKHLDVVNYNQTSVEDQSKKFISLYKDPQNIKEPIDIESQVLALNFQQNPVIDKVIELLQYRLEGKLNIDFIQLELQLDIALAFDPFKIKSKVKESQDNFTKNFNIEISRMKENGELNLLSSIHSQQELHTDNEPFWSCDFLDISDPMILSELIFIPQLEWRIKMAKYYYSNFKFSIINKLNDIFKRFKDFVSYKIDFKEIPLISETIDKLREDIIIHKEEYNFKKHMRNLQKCEIICETANKLQIMTHALVIISEFDANQSLIEFENNFMDSATNENLNAQVKLIYKINIDGFVEQVEFKLFLKQLQDSNINYKKLKQIMDYSQEEIFQQYSRKDELISKVQSQSKLICTNEPENVSDSVDLMRKDPFYYQFASLTLKNNYDFTKAAVFNDGILLKYAPNDFKANAAICEVAVDNNPDALDYVDQTILENRKIGLVVAKKYPMQIKKMDPKIRDVYEIMNQALRLNGFAVEFIGKNQTENKELLKVAQQQNGLAIISTNNRIKEDFELVMAAVKQNGLAIKQVSNSMLKNKEIVQQAYCNNPNSFEQADISIKNDIEFVRKCQKVDKKVQNYINEVMQEELGLKTNRIFDKLNKPSMMGVVENEMVMMDNETLVTQIEKHKHERYFHINDIFLNKGKDILLQDKYFKQYKGFVNKNHSKFKVHKCNFFELMSNKEPEFLDLRKNFNDLPSFARIDLNIFQCDCLKSFLYEFIYKNKGGLLFKIDVSEEDLDDDIIVDSSQMHIILKDENDQKYSQYLNFQVDHENLKKHLKNEELYQKIIKYDDDLVKSLINQFVSVNSILNIPYDVKLDLINQKQNSLKSLLQQFDIFKGQLKQSLEQQKNLEQKQIVFRLPVHNFYKLTDGKKEYIKLNTIRDFLDSISKEQSEFNLSIKFIIEVEEIINLRGKLNEVYDIMNHEHAILGPLYRKNRIFIGWAISDNGYFSDIPRDILIDTMTRLYYNIQNNHLKQPLIALPSKYFSPVFKIDPSSKTHDEDVEMAQLIQQFFSDKLEPISMVNAISFIDYQETVARWKENNIQLSLNILEIGDEVQVNLRALISSVVSILVVSGRYLLFGDQTLEDVFMQLVLKQRLNWLETKQIVLNYLDQIRNLDYDEKISYETKLDSWYEKYVKGERANSVKLDVFLK